MDRSLENCLATKQNVVGVLCADGNGLLISSKGELDGALAGRYTSMLRHASSLAVDQPPPTVVIETQMHSIILRDYDTLTVAMKCKREGMEDT